MKKNLILADISTSCAEGWEQARRYVPDWGPGTQLEMRSVTVVFV